MAGVNLGRGREGEGGSWARERIKKKGGRGGVKTVKHTYVHTYIHTHTHTHIHTYFIKFPHGGFSKTIIQVITYI